MNTSDKIPSTHFTARTNRLYTASLSLTCLSLALGYSLDQSWGWAGMILVLGLFGWIGQQGLPSTGKSGQAVSNLLFIALVFAAGVGAARGIFAPLMLISILAALATWDLSAFQQRLQAIEPNSETYTLENAHFKRLSKVIGLGLAISVLGLVMKIEINLSWAVILGLVIILGIRFSIRSLVNKTGED